MDLSLGILVQAGVVKLEQEGREKELGEFWGDGLDPSSALGQEFIWNQTHPSDKSIQLWSNWSRLPCQAREGGREE